MKILLISTNNERFPVPVPPAGLAQIAGTLRSHGHNVKVLDLCFEKNASSSVTGAVSSFAPELTGISFRNLDNSSAIGTKSYIPDLCRIVSSIRSAGPTEIIIGGSGFSCAPDEILRQTGIRYGITGDGEVAIIKFLESFTRGGDVSYTPGLVYMQDGQVRRNSIKAHAILDELPLPAWDLVDTSKYISNGGCAAVQTKRGCSFKCIYCSYPVIEGCRYRLQSPKSVVDGIEKMNKEQGTSCFFFVDSVFSFPEEHARNICREICRRKLQIRWEAMVNPVAVTADLVQAMEESGCIGVEFGLDTASKKMLHSLRKGFTQDDISRAFAFYSKAKIPMSIYLLIGGPGETEETVSETVGFLDGAGDFSQVMMNFGIRIYEGTELAEISRREGRIGKDENLMNPKIYISEMLPSYFLDTLDGYCSTRPSWSDATDWNSRTSRIMLRLASFCGMRPFWKHSFIMGLTRNLLRFGEFNARGTAQC